MRYILIIWLLGTALAFAILPTESTCLPACRALGTCIRSPSLPTANQPSGHQTTFQYDDQGRLTRQADSVCTNINTYDDNGNRASRSDGGLTQTWVCDANNRATNYTDGAGHTLSYG